MLLKAKQQDNKKNAVEVSSVKNIVKNSGKYFEAEVSFYATIEFTRTANEDYKVTSYTLSKPQCL